MRIHPKEIESVLQLEPRERYMHFIKVVADSREVWSLRSDGGWAVGGATLSDGGEVDYFPVWPSELLTLWAEVSAPRLQVSHSVVHVGDDLSEFGVSIPSGRLHGRTRSRISEIGDKGIMR